MKFCGTVFHKRGDHPVKFKLWGDHPVKYTKLRGDLINKI